LGCGEVALGLKAMRLEHTRDPGDAVDRRLGEPEREECLREILAQKFSCGARLFVAEIVFVKSK
jgi:hypothetical protein